MHKDREGEKVIFGRSSRSLFGNSTHPHVNGWVLLEGRAVRHEGQSEGYHHHVSFPHSTAF